MKPQKRLAAQILKCSPHRVRFDPERLSDIEEAITKVDIKGLVKEGAIKEKPITGIARGRARKTARQKSKGQRKGHGSRKGTAFAREGRKKAWMNKIRAQRRVLRELREKGMIDGRSFREIYSKAGGGYFRSVRHVKLYIEEKGLWKKK